LGLWDSSRCLLLRYCQYSRYYYCTLMLKAVASCFSDWCHCNECKRGRSTSAESVSASAHYSPALQQLHWLPVKHCVTFKTATLMHQILQKRCPSYLADLVTSNTTYSQRRHLRSSTTRSAAVRRARTQFGKRAFSICSPDVWNSLPTALRHIDSYPAFRRALKSHLFSSAFSS